MRELKFRAWCEKIQYYFYDVAIYPNGIVARKSNALLDTLTEGETHWHELDNAVIEQYTGLKDKNGKEIYEGDILKLYDRFVSAITWDTAAASFQWFATDGDGYCMLNELDKDCYEVIGNIHENPELLEREDAKG